MLNSPGKHVFWSSLERYLTLDPYFMLAVFVGKRGAAAASAPALPPLDRVAALRLSAAAYGVSLPAVPSPFVSWNLVTAIKQGKALLRSSSSIIPTPDLPCRQLYLFSLCCTAATRGSLSGVSFPIFLTLRLFGGDDSSVSSTELAVAQPLLAEGGQQQVYQRQQLHRKGDCC